MKTAAITVDFDPNHMRGIASILRPSDAVDFASVPDPMAVAKHYADNGIAVTVVHNGYVLAVGGVLNLWEGVGEWWSLTTIYAEKYPKQFHKAAKDMIMRAELEMKLHRLQAAIRADNQKAINWHARLGFTNEGIMRAYGVDGTDYFRMALTWHS
ncbi:GNAT family N-acetyltransferase [Primorskyibacter sedentarius]|uniref:GNAT family N-acetyltransferase n=1 Tax=Primorskyibacter sedentarius TaxID=745311 RepID=UPI003EBC3C30